MKVEANCFSGTKTEEDKLLESHIVSSGDWEGITFLGRKIKIAVFCSADNNGGSVLIKDPEERIGGVLRFESQDDQKGKDVMSIGSRIGIAGKQELLIYARGRKSVKKVLVFLTFDSDRYQDQENDPQGILGESPSSPPVSVS